MEIKHALFVHGHSAVIQYPERIDSLARQGNYVHVKGRPSTTNWLHFAVPTAVIIDDCRMRPAKIWFRYKANRANVTDIRVYDGERSIDAMDDDNTESFSDDDWTRMRMFIDSGKNPAVFWGIGISIGIEFGPAGGWIEFDTAGCDFFYATRLGSQRLRISTDKKQSMEFPYRSNMPIDVANDAIERILVSLHGTGGNADEYLFNGMAAVRKAVEDGVEPNALNNTLVIAPQFIIPDECYTELAPNILQWRDGNRAYSSNSIEQDLDGDGIPDSGTLDSFTVMDTLLERVCRKSLFKNLRNVVIAGQSNGGRFMSCYAATSRFEQDIATPRGFHMRYLVMGSGSYLYMDESRLAFVGDTYKSAAHSDDWEDTIVDLERGDFDTVCAEDAARFNDWPWGLDNLNLWPYPERVTMEQIQNQFGSRDVHYLVAELDLIPSNTDCPERVQGQDTLAKTLLYFWHLKQRYPSGLSHQLHVVPGVEHSGLDIMTSPLGVAAIFG